jgi:hypothetical protein
LSSIVTVTGSTAIPSNLPSELETVVVTSPLWLPSRIQSSLATTVILWPTFQLEGVNVISDGPVNAI